MGKRIRMQCRACNSVVKVKRSKVERKQIIPLAHKGCTKLGNRRLVRVRT